MLGELKTMLVIEKAVQEAPLKVEKAQNDEKPENNEIDLDLRTISVILHEKIEEVMVRLNSLDVELIEDMSDFSKYVIDFSIEHALGQKYGAAEPNIKSMFGIDENDERFIEVSNVVNNLLLEVAKESRVIKDNGTGDIFNEPIIEHAIDLNEYFYDDEDHSKVHIPPVWTPAYKRTNAAFVYLYFRHVCKCVL